MGDQFGKMRTVHVVLAALLLKVSGMTVLKSA